MSLRIEELNKTYANGVKALDRLCLEIPIGMFGLLGPNGAGKSTLMRILATLQLPDTGLVAFNGIDVLKAPFELRRQLGYLPQSFGVYPRQSARSLLRYLAVLKGVSSKQARIRMVDEVLEKTNLTAVQHNYVSDYSGGMKQRFGIAQLLLNQPKLIIVDEPTAGLDPSERKRFLNVLRDLGTEHTVLFSTHIVEDVKALCQDMAIIAEGRILKHAPPSAALAEMEGCIWVKKGPSEALSGIGQRHFVISDRLSEDNEQMVRVFAKERPDETFQPVKPVLEDVYFITLNSGE